MEVGTGAAFQITEQIRRRLKREVLVAGSISDTKLEEVIEDAVAAALDLKQEEIYISLLASNPMLLQLHLLSLLQASYLKYCLLPTPPALIFF